MLIIEIAKIEFNRRPYWIYCIYIDYQNEIRIMLIIEMAKIESTGGHIDNMVLFWWFIEIISILQHWYCIIRIEKEKIEIDSTVLIFYFDIYSIVMIFCYYACL